MKKTLVVALVAALLAACGGGPDEPEPTVCEYLAGRIQGAGCPYNDFGEDVAECEATLADLGACRSLGEAWMVCLAGGPFSCVDGYAMTLAECPAETAAFFDCMDAMPTKPAPR